MADVNVKTLQTRIALKYDTYANWTNEEVAGQGANLVLLAGEIGFCEIPSESTAATTAPTVLFKVGDGETPFKSLKWASALAADVYGWAKAANVELEGKSIKFKDAAGATVKEIAIPYMTESDVKAITDPLAARILAVENKFAGDDSVQNQINGLDQRLDVIEGSGEGSVAKALADAKAYTDEREDAIELAYQAYADQAETDAVATAKGYTDTEVKKVSDAAEKIASDLSAHVGNEENPHKVTKAQVGLGNVDNKSVAEIKSEFTGAIEADNAGFVTGNAAHVAIEAAKAAAASDAAGKVKALEDGQVAKNAEDIATNAAAISANASAIETEASERAAAISEAVAGVTAAYEAADLAINNKIGAVTEGKTVIEMIAAAQTAAEGKVTALENGAVADNTADIRELEQALADEKSAREGADSGLNTRLEKVEAFFAEAQDEDGNYTGLTDTLDTLVEIQRFLSGEGSEVDEMLDTINEHAAAIEALESVVGDAESGLVMDMAQAQADIDDVEADVADVVATLDGYDKDNTVKAAVDAAQTDATQALADALAASNKVDTKAAEIKTAYEGYADGKASAAEAAANSYTDGKVAALNEKDAALAAEDSRLAGLISGNTETIAAMDTAYKKAVSDEATAREQAINDINAAIGTFEGTVAEAVAGVKATAEDAQSRVAALEPRVEQAEKDIDALEAIVNAEGGNSNAQLRADITTLQELTGDASKGNEALRSELTTLQGIVNNETTGLAATKAIADEALTKAKDAQSRVSAIEADYLKAADAYIFNCGSSTAVVHVAASN